MIFAIAILAYFLNRQWTTDRMVASLWCQPEGATPRLETSKWIDAGNVLLEFAVAQTGPGDMLVLCDGRSKEARKKIVGNSVCPHYDACVDSYRGFSICAAYMLS